MKELIIVGAGGFGRELLQMVKEINAGKCKWKIKGFIDDCLEALDPYECDYKVIGTIADWRPQENEVFACAIANPEMKKKVTQDLMQRGAEFTSIVHPDARISEFCKLGKGIVVFSSAAVSVNTRVGDFVTLLASGIGHDVEIGDYSTISANCDITGGVKIANNVFVGTSVTIVPQVKVGEGAYICAGSVVMTKVRANTKVIGYPAKRMRLSIE